MDTPSSDELARRAASFGSQAAVYAAERPGYADAAVRWALEPVTRPRVLDLAAGTGKLTEGILPYASEVVAVEPDAEMRAELMRELPGVRALAGTAEEIPLPDASVDAITVGQALHWFDLDRAMPEMARVLAPGGVLACLWNLDDVRVPWVRSLAEVYGTAMSLEEWRARAPLSPGPRFPSVEAGEFEHLQRRTAESLAAGIGTQSRVLILDDDERAALMERVLGRLRATPETAHGEFDLPLITLTVRATLV